MINAEFTTVPLEVIGGLYTEATPETLPLGASPCVINCDFIIGSEFQRPGKFSFFYYSGYSVTENTNSATSIAGTHAPNEVAWTTPTNAELDVPGTYATVSLNSPVGTTFLGTSQYVSTANTFVFNYGTAQTVIFTFKTTTTLGGIFVQANRAQLAPFVEAGVTGTQPYFAVFMNTAGTLEVAFFNDTAIQFSGATSASYNDGNLHQCAVTLNAGTITIYVDGVSVLTSAKTPSASTVACNWIIAWGPDYFAGWPTFYHNINSYMANVAVWHDTVISGTHIAEVFAGTLPLTSLSPDSLWELEDTGTTAVDSVGSNTGTYQVNVPASLFQGAGDVFNGVMAISGGGATQSATGNTGIEAINVGDSIIIQLQTDPEFSTTNIQVTGVTDSLGNTYTQMGQSSLFFDAGGDRNITMQYFWCQSILAAAATSSITFTVTMLSTGGYILDQVNVFSMPSLLTVAGGGSVDNNGTIAGAVFSSPTVTTTAAEVLLSQGGSDVSSELAVGSPFTLLTGNSGGNGLISVGYIPQVGGTYQSNWTGITGHHYGTILTALLIANGRTTNVGTIPYSQILQCINYPFSIPSTQNVIGFQVLVYGDQSTTDSNVILTVSLVSPSADSPTFTGQLPAIDGVPLTLGEPTTNWGLSLSPSVFNNPNFGVDVVASATDGTAATFNIYAVKITVWLTPNPPPSFNYLKTFAQTDGAVLNMALGSDGVFYQEDAINDPGVLTAAYTAIQPNSFAQSATVDDREFIAISNLQNGTDIPYTYSPPNFTRMTQVGPGAAPSATSTTSGSAITSITQQPAFSLPTSGFIGVSASPQDHGNFGTPSTPGNVFTIVLNHSVLLPTYTVAGVTYQTFQVGQNLVLAGCPTLNGFVVDNDPTGVTAPPYYTITSVGMPITGQTYYDAITFTVNFTTFYWPNAVHNPAGITIQSTLAIMTTAVQVPNLEVGGSFQVTGTGGAPPAGYDSAWNVLQTFNAANLSITSTELLNNVAIYGFIVQTGANPAVGEAITVTLTLNGNGVFNVTNAIITAVSGGTLSVSLPGANISTAAEEGAGLIFGTIFQFDALAIIGDTTGGTVVTSGVIGVGQRMICYCFLTENGSLTEPSPTFTFDVLSGASSIAVANLLTGPSNVIARYILITAAGGGQFYYIGEPVQVTVNGVVTTYTATVVNDNSTTNVNLTFTDTVLLSSTEVDIQGNNLFENYELGSCLAVVPYAQRVFIVGEQNKVFNFLNWSFDGGIVVTQSQGGSTSTAPAGWTVDPTNGGGGSVINSPIFGSAYQISNTTGSTQAIYGMITQAAYQDQLLVAIIEPSTLYSIRVTCACPSGAASGNLVTDLYSAKIGQSLGTFTIPLSGLSTSMTIQTGTLLTTSLSPVPPDLVWRIYVTNIPTGVTVTLDRAEPYPTSLPVLNTQVIGSYQNEFEQFDRITGVVLTSQQNQQPCVTAFTLYGTLYLVKTGSMLAVSDNEATEPSYWTIPRTVSNSVGAFGVYAVTTGVDEPNTGEEWALIAGQAGLYLFQGQQPVKLSDEIQSVWNQINKKYAYTVWVKNDITNRRVLVGVPLNALDADGESPTWLPAGVLTNGTNPTTPNAILELNYKELNTAGAVESSPQIHRSYSGKMIASDLTRKWNIWNIVAPCAAFLQQADTSNPLFVGNSQNTGKIYELVDRLMEDDGVAINQIYTTAGFVPTETGQALQIGMTRFAADYMTLIITGSGELVITAYPNTFDEDNPYIDVLSPNLNLPTTNDGDTEVPLNEVGNRIFIQFSSNAVGAGFGLARVVLAMSKDPWSPVRGN